MIVGGRDTLKVFNAVIFVLLEILKVNKSVEFKFDDADVRLSATYARIMKNKSFLKLLDDHGWIYHEDDGDDKYFVLKKVNNASSN